MQKPEPDEQRNDEMAEAVDSGTDTILEELPEGPTADQEVIAQLQAQVAELMEQIQRPPATTTEITGEDGVQIIVEPPELAEEEFEEVHTEPIRLRGLENLVRQASGQILVYGPFDDYTIVNTDFGEYGMSQGLIIGFQIRDWFNKKESRMEQQPFSVYWDSATGDPVRGNAVAFEDYKKPGQRG